MYTYRYNDALAIQSISISVLVIVLVSKRVREALLNLLSGLVPPVVIQGIETLCLDHAIDSGTSKTSKDFFGQGVACRLAVLFAVILVGLGSLESSGASDQFVAQTGLVRRSAVVSDQA